MEGKLQIGYQELVALVRQLPASQIAQLKSELTDNFIEEKAKIAKSQLRQFLLNGPIMTDEEYENYQQNRKWISQWRTK